MDGAQQSLPEYFTTYTLEASLSNGKAHYTSQDGTRAIAYGEYGNWELQDKSTG